MHLRSAWHEKDYNSKIALHDLFPPEVLFYERKTEGLK